MTKAWIKGTILGAIILYVWMMVSWMALPWHTAALKKFGSDDSVAAVLTANTTESGIYTLPAMGSGDQKAHLEAAKKGPLLFAAVRKEGYDFASPKPYIISFIIQLVGAALVTYLLLKARPMPYWDRVGFVTVFGIAAGVLAAFPEWNWWGFSLQYTLVEFFDFVIGWFLAGLAMAYVVNGKK